MLRGDPMRKRTRRKKLPPIIEIPLPDIGGLERNARAYAMGECRIITGRGAAGWHLSISHPTRYPTWDEVAEARYNLLPLNATIAMLLPPPSEYVNIHDTTFHLWEVPELRRMAVRYYSGRIIGYERAGRQPPVCAWG